MLHVLSALPEWHLSTGIAASCAVHEQGNALHPHGLKSPYVFAEGCSFGAEVPTG